LVLKFLKESKSQGQESEKMSIQKAIIPEKGVCKITFTLTDTLVDHPKEVALVGDFNNWDPSKNSMKKSQRGWFEDTIELPLGKDYQFRYLVDKKNWENDWQADAYASTPFNGAYNMVVICDH